MTGPKPMRHRLRYRPGAATILACIWALAAGACADDGSEPNIPGAGELVAGGADFDGTGFVPVADGDEVELVAGSQGGFHVWLSMNVRGLAGDLVIEREARRADTGELVYRGRRQELTLPAEAVNEWWTQPEATPAFMCPSPIGIKVYDEDLIFEIRILDRDDRVIARDQRILTPRCPADRQDFCHSICSG